MGFTSYSSAERMLRANTLGYYTKPVDEIFTQQREQRIHESMSPKGIDKRECRDSEAHPKTIPIILSLDLTGSMGKIPHSLVKNGLPTLMGNLIQMGIKDVSLLFLGVGDHECDRYPLQVGQFESGDAELDLWLTRTYIEGGGGGNAGESYLLSWYFAANHTITDSWEKRRQKGFLFTVGDEPCLKSLPPREIKEIMRSTARGQVMYDVDLLAEAQKTYHVFHLHVMEGSAGHRSLNYWKNLLGQNCLKMEDYTKIPNIIVETVLSNIKTTNIPIQQKQEFPTSPFPKVEEIL